MLRDSHSVLVGIYWTSMRIKRSRREPNNSPVSSAQVLNHNTQVPLVLTFAVKWRAESEGCAGIWN